MKPACSVDGCEKPVLAKGLCSAHYCRNKKWGSPTGGLPERPRRPEACTVDGCDGLHYSLGYCAAHYQRHRRGDALNVAVARRQPRTPDRVVTDSNGYQIFFDPNHPLAAANGYVYVHRDVMMKMLGRPLREGENVHHRDGNRSRNDPDNLELWLRPQPWGQRVEDNVAHAYEILAIYGPPDAADIAAEVVRRRAAEMKQAAE